MISTEKPGTPEELVHYGVKGMKWGVRRKRSASGSSGSSTKSAVVKGAKKAGRIGGDILFEFGANSSGIREDIAEKAGKAFQSDLPAIKARHRASGGSKLSTRVLKPASSAARAYRNDAKNAYLKRLEEAANANVNLSGTRQYTLSEQGKPNTSKYYWRVRTKSIEHAAEAAFLVHPVFDSDGYIVRVEYVEDSMAQAMAVGEAFIKHYAW